MAISGANLLLVDDDPECLRLLGRLLADHGYRIRVAESGDQALATLAALPADEPIDLVLLDILMPGEVDGIDTCRRIKARDGMGNTPVIFLTGRDDRQTMVQAFAAGGADYVLKPFNTDVLLARVRTHTELGRLSRGLESALAERTDELRDANRRLRRLAAEVSLVAERERERLARELHDSPMQQLSLAQMQVTTAARHPGSDESQGQLEVGLELMRDALGQLRTLQFELSPPVLRREGLGAALRWLASHTSERFGLDLRYAGAGQLPPLRWELAVGLFQCARELTYNLVKHAGATGGLLALHAQSAGIQVVVSDNGHGFPDGADRTTADADGGYGLFAIRERLKLWGGTLDIESGPSGTRATLLVPLAMATERRRLPRPATAPASAPAPVPARVPS